MINKSDRESRVSVCFATDDNYVQHLSVAIASMLINSKCERGIDIYILTDGLLSEQSERRLRSLCRHREDVAMEFVTVDESLFANCWVQGRFTLPSYYRLFITKILPTLDRTIYLDCDIAVVGDIVELYEIDLNGCSIGAIKDANGSYHKGLCGIDSEDFGYCNSGVLLMDLARMRHLGIDHMFERSLIEDRDRAGECVDQNLINIVMERTREFCYLGHEWNLYYNSVEFDQELYAKALASPKVIHFLGGKKPWEWGCAQERQGLYWRYLLHTPYRWGWLGGQCRRLWWYLSPLLWESVESADRSVWRIKIFRLTLFKRREVEGQRRYYILGLRIK